MTTEELQNQNQIIEKTFTKILAENMQGIEKNFQTIIEEKFKKTVKDLNLDKSNFKHGIFPVAGGEDENISKAMRFKGLLKAVFAKDVEYFKKNLNGSVDSDGGFLVPEEFMTEIQRIAAAFGVVRKYGLVMPLSSDKASFPSDAGSVTVNWQGVQGAAGQKSTPKFGKVVLNTDTLIGLTLWSEQLAEDTNVNLMNYLLTLFAEKFAEEEDYQGFRGTGSPYVGILNETGTNIATMDSGNVNFDDVTLDNLLDMQTAVPATARAQGAYFMHTTLWGAIQKIKQNNQNVVSFQNPITPMTDLVNVQPLLPVGNIWNAPVIPCDAMPSLTDTAVSTPFIVFGSLKRGLMLGERNRTTIAQSNVAVVGGESAFETIQQAIRVTERIAIKVNLPAAFSVLRTAAS